MIDETAQLDRRLTMILVKEIMSTEVKTLTSEHSLADARGMMTSNNIRHIPVVNANQQLVGLVTHRDVLAYGVTPQATDHNQRQAIEEEIKLEAIMVHGVKTISKDKSLRIAALMMEQHRFGCLPVVTEDKKIVGILTGTDFVGLAINLLEQLEETQSSEEDW